MTHVRSLAFWRSRTAGTSGEVRAIHYVKQVLRGAAVDVRIEPFRFRSYDLHRAVLRVGGLSVEPARIVFDPYHGTTDIIGDVAFVTAAEVNGGNGVARLDLSQRVVVTTNEARYSRIADRQPLAIVLISDHDFDKLKGTGARRAKLLIQGKVRTVRSANLVAATLNPSTSREIILSAHIDSAGTQGAQDNASGVAVLLELARILPKLALPFRLRFVFFGAEELGLFGSRASGPALRGPSALRARVQHGLRRRKRYLDRHEGRSARPAGCERSQPAAPRVFRQGKRRSNLKGRWALVGPERTFPDASNVPPWLQAAILDSVRELGYQINRARVRVRTTGPFPRLVSLRRT